MTCIKTSTYIAALALGLAMASPAQAQARDEGQAQSDHIASLKACQEIAEPSARLACFDSSVSVMVSANDAGELRLLGQEEMSQTRRRLFGFSLPRIGLFGGGKGDEEMETLESTITRVRYIRDDAFTFEIAEGGATWQVTNAPTRLRQVRVGNRVEFQRAALGSYFIRIDGQIGVKGKRIQ